MNWCAIKPRAKPTLDMTGCCGTARRDNTITIDVPEVAKQKLIMWVTPPSPHLATADVLLMCYDCASILENLTGAADRTPAFLTQFNGQHVYNRVGLYRPAWVPLEGSGGRGRQCFVE
jgi:hypothetical protein